MDEDIQTVKKTARTRKTTKVVTDEEPVLDIPTIKSTTSLPSVTDTFNNLIIQITERKQEFENLQIKMDQTRKAWVQEQQDSESEILRKKQQVELERQREQETYQYNLNLTRKRAEDEFLDKKSAWEKELLARKDEIQKEKEDLETLRKQVSQFDSQIQNAVKQAQDSLRSELTSEFEADRKLREQEVKSEKEILGLKIEGFTAEVKRQSEEVTVLKRSLDQAQAQVKDIAVKVIEGGTPSKPQTPPD